MNSYDSMSLNTQIQTPVLFLVFNRIDTTKKVFEMIRHARPRRLYVAADGSRNEIEGESDNVALVREIATNVDWDCEVRTLFREENLGCKMAVSSAISWFFENEEEGIILEDDCLPSQSYFLFCQELLEKYRHDTRIMMIAGANFLPPIINIESDYFFSRYFSIWGWASWRRAWKYYDIQINDWEELKKERKIDGLYKQEYFKDQLKKAFDNVSEGKINTWDYQWYFACLFNNGLSVVPRVNLISNIGDVGYHSKGTSKSHFLPLSNICNVTEMKHPKFMCPEYMYDNNYINEYYQPKKKNLMRSIMEYISKQSHFILSNS